MEQLEVGWIVKWHSYFGDKTGKVIGVVDTGSAYLSEQGKSTQGFPGTSSPILVARKDIYEVVSRGDSE
jgi:hypothetical protein